MGSKAGWVLGLACSVAVLVLAASSRAYFVHMAIAAATGVAVAWAAFRSSRSLEKTGAEAIAREHLSFMAMIWAWGGVALFVTYAFVLHWREWWQFFGVFCLLAVVSYVLSSTLSSDAARPPADPVMLTLARGLTIFVFVAMLIVMVGLLLDGKMWRFTTVAGQRPGSQDWAGNNIFFFGALGLAAVSWNALCMLRAHERATS